MAFLAITPVSVYNPSIKSNWTPIVTQPLVAQLPVLKGQEGAIPVTALQPTVTPVPLASDTWMINPALVVSVEDRTFIFGSPFFVIRMQDGWAYSVIVDPAL